MKRSVVLVALATWLALCLPLTAEETTLAIVVSKSNHVDQLSMRDLVRIYQGDLEKWPDGQRIVGLDYSSSSSLRVQFYRRVLQAEPDQEFFHPGSPIPFQAVLLSSETSIRRFVARIPNAIGYLPASMADDTVKIIKINGRLPHEDAYALQ